MNRLIGLWLAGLIITCGIDSDRDVREVHQVDGGVLYKDGCLYFDDTKGFHNEACRAPCFIEEGTMKPAGSDLREPEHEPPAVPLEHADDTGLK